MRGYYYDQTGGAPRSIPTSISAGRRRWWNGAAAALLFLLTMALLGGLTAAAGSWNHSRLEGLPALADSTWRSLPVREELPKETTAERIPIGDGTTLTISPLPSDGAHSPQEIYRENIASIVSIRGSKGDGMGLDTGVVMSEDGYIVTNNYVIEGCGAADVVLQDECVFQALLMEQDAQGDLAVLKTDCVGLTPAQFGNSVFLEVGDAVAAIGNPLGEELRGVTTDGIISAINRDVNMDGYIMVPPQITAALNSGNSGGTPINDRGQMAGIASLKMRAYNNMMEGLGSAIPTATVKTVVDTPIAHGQAEGRPTIGIIGYTVTEELVEEYGYPRGVIVQSVQEGPDTQRQGVLPNDVVVAVSGETIINMDQLQMIRKGPAVGNVLTFRLWRGGRYPERDVVLVGQYTLEEQIKEEHPILGRPREVCVGEWKSRGLKLHSPIG